jgi:hypothetical protein
MVQQDYNLKITETEPMDPTKYDLAVKLREQRRILDLIPPPDEVFIAAAKNACVQAGLSQETIDILHPPSSEPNMRLSR